LRSITHFGGYPLSADAIVEPMLEQLPHVVRPDASAPIRQLEASS
jgi:hypothetical protein